MLRSTCLACCLAVAACQRAPSEDPDEVARFERSIDALRDAENHEKQPYLDRLRSLECSTPKLCELKRVCSSAYARHIKALLDVEAIRAAATKTPGAVEKLDEAKRALVEAKNLAQRCVTLQAELHERGGKG